MTVTQQDPTYVPPSYPVSTFTAARMAGLLVGAREYLEALERVAMYEGRLRPRCLPPLRLARDVLIEWTKGNIVDPDACSCPDPGGLSKMADCPVHDADPTAYPAPVIVLSLPQARALLECADITDDTSPEEFEAREHLRALVKARTDG